MKIEKTKQSIPVPQPERPLPPGVRHPLEAVADSITGLVRRRNEDSYLYCRDASGKYLLAAVADGIGCTRNGDAASCYALQMLAGLWQKLVFPKVRQQSFSRDFLMDAFLKINQRLFEINQVTKDLYERDSLGTTLTAAVFLQDVMVAVNAGDSPIFRVRDGQIRQLTFDHNLSCEMERSGKLVEDEEILRDYGRLLTRFIGLNVPVEPEYYIANVRPGDRFLLCSDGLTLHVKPDEICKLLTQKENISEALKLMFSRIFHRGAMDNATAIVLRAV